MLDRSFVVALLVVWILDAPLTPTYGQSSVGIAGGEVSVYVDGTPINWQELSSFPADSVGAIIHYTIRRLADDGYLLAAVDSVAGTLPVRLYVSSGPLLRVGEIAFSGDSGIDVDEMTRMMETGIGEPLRQSVLENDIQFLVAEHSRRGWPVAEARISSVRPVSDETQELRIEIEIERGQTVVLKGIRLPGADRTRPAYISRLTGLRTGKTIRHFDGARIRRKLLATNDFEDVGEPRLELQPDGDAILVVPIKDEAPGNFDLVLGYVPKTSVAGQGGLVGNGHLELRNLFGGGRRFNLRLNRLPGRVSSVDAGVADPNVAGLPIGIEGSFSGLQQDSTYDKQRYAALFSYELSEGLYAVASATREITKPGQAGLQLRSGRQRIPRSTAAFFGIGVRYESVDSPINPRSGLHVESMFERGNKHRTFRLVDSMGDTLTTRVRAGQERLSMRIRYFLPTIKRQLVVIGADAQLVLSDDYDESDLVRLGGAQSLRGYNEEQFRGRVAGRFLVEYRYQLDRYSFAYGFTDVGLIERASIGGLAARREILPGFGIGMQFRTEVGIINVSYAFNDRDGPIDGRVHVGLSFSL